MSHFILPQGDQAALMPGAAYSVPGLFQFSGLLYDCLDQVQAKFGYQIPVHYLYGAPQVRWNSGRLLFRKQAQSPEEIQAELTGAVDRGITPLLTFSATDIRPEEWADPLCNQILKWLDALQGGVIVSDLGLNEYIRVQYPHVERHASVIMTAFAATRDAAYYTDLTREFRRYVVHPDDNHRPELLAQLPKEPAEIILNERCGYQCARRGDHYRSIARSQRDLLDTGHCEPNFLEHCPFIPEGKQRSTTERTISLTTRDAVRLHAQGFPLFKLQGRLDSPYVFFFDFLRYTLDNEVAFPTMFPVFSYRIRAFEKEKAQRKTQAPEEAVISK